MIKIDIVENYLEEGWSGDCLRCPIALALKDQGHKNVWVDQKFVVLNDEVYSLPKEARHFIEDFDRDYEVKPFSFEITDRILPLPDQQFVEEFFELDAYDTNGEF